MPMIQREFSGTNWIELAKAWNLSTKANSELYGADYDVIQGFLYIIWRRTAGKRKSFIRKRVAADLRQFVYTLYKKNNSVYTNIWFAMAGMPDDDSLILISIPLLPYMLY